MLDEGGAAKALEGLNKALVKRIAWNEAGIAERDMKGHDGSGLPIDAAARFYLRRYLRDDGVFGTLAAAAFEVLEPIGRAALGRAGDSDEFIVGYALASAARSLAGGDMAIGAFPGDLIASRSHRLVGDAVLDLSFESVDPARLEGVDPDRPVMSQQSVTPRDIMVRAGTIEFGGGRTASDLLTWTDCDGIAEDLMDSFGGLELDYADLEDVDLRIADILTDRLPQGPTEAEPPAPARKMDFERCI